jgi:predicted permease
LNDISGTQAFTDKKKESLITALYVGGIFIILALIFVLDTGIWGRLVNFFSTLTLAQVPGTSISLPAPLNPASHLQLYNAAFQFSIGIGILEIVILAVRILLHSPLARKAETIENLVFWLGTSYLIISYLVNMTLQTEWFVFWAGIILVAGLSLVTRAFILLVGRYR